MESPRRRAKDALHDAFAQAAKGLAHPKRLELLDLLAQGERSVDALARSAALGVTSTSAHLQSLHQAGLVARRRDGQRVLYRLAGGEVAGLLAALRRVAQRHVAGAEPARRAFLGVDGERDVPVREVDRLELLAAARDGELVVLDVRPPAEFAAGHLPGALSIPVDELAERVGELPADVDIVAYCRGAFCVMSFDAVRLLLERGRSAAVLSEGVLEWRADGERLCVAA